MNYLIPHIEIEKTDAIQFNRTDDQVTATTFLSNKQYKHLLLYGGSRSGKTVIFLRSIVLRACKTPDSRHLILRFHFNACKRSIWHDTLPKVKRMCFPNLKWKENAQDMFIRLPNESEIWFGGLDDKDRVEKILGNEYATIFFNECHEMNYDGVTTALTRLAQKTKLTNKAYYDCNPPSKRSWVYKLFVLKVDPESNAKRKDGDKYASFKMNPEGNLQNIDSEYMSELENMPFRKRNRFLLGEWQDDMEGALWTRDLIDAYRAQYAPREMKRVVIGVDPAVTVTERSNNTGIIIVCQDPKGHFYVLDDRTIKATPLGWGQVVVNSYNEFEGDAVVGEVNNGGDLVESNVRVIDKTIKFVPVRATRGKYRRAEPIEGLYEQGLVHHVGVFPELEDEMCNFNPQNEETMGDMDSPDRMDALVWALAYMSGEIKQKRVGPLF